MTLSGYEKAVQNLLAEIARGSQDPSQLAIDHLTGKQLIQFLMFLDVVPVVAIQSLGAEAFEVVYVEEKRLKGNTPAIMLRQTLVEQYNLNHPERLHQTNLNGVAESALHSLMMAAVEDKFHKDN